MLVAIDASRAARGQKTGVEGYAYQIIEGLKTALPDYVSVILYTDTSLTGELAQLPANWRVTVLAWLPRRLWTQFRLAVAVWQDKPDVLFVPAHVVPECLPPQTRVVTTIHDVAAARYPQAYNWFERWYSLRAARVALQRGRVVVPSLFTEKELLRLWPQTPIGRIVPIPHGLNPEYRVGTTPSVLAEMKKANNVQSPYLIMVGRLETKKNTVAVVRAFGEFKKTELGRTYQLVLVGKPGHGYEEFKKAWHESPNRADIRCLGWLEDAATKVLMSGAAALVFPSSYEGFGLPALEAAALGVPVISLRGHAVAEIGDDMFVYAESTESVDLAEAMTKAVAMDVAQCQRARARALEFTWARTAQRTAAILID